MQSLLDKVEKFKAEAEAAPEFSNMYLWEAIKLIAGKLDVAPWAESQINVCLCSEDWTDGGGLCSMCGLERS